MLGRVRISVEKLQAILTLNERYFYCVRDPFQQQQEAMRCVLFLRFLLYYRDAMKTTSSLATLVLRRSSCNLPDLISWGKEKCNGKSKMKKVMDCICYNSRSMRRILAFDIVILEGLRFNRLVLETSCPPNLYFHSNNTNLYTTQTQPEPLHC